MNASPLPAPDTVIRAFVDAINRGDVDALASLMTDDHVFVDSDGTEVRGRDGVRRGWVGYFAMFPDYAITVEETLTHEQTVVLLGNASGTHAPGGTRDPARHWSVPAAWRALVAGERVARWQVYVNPEPILRALRA